jgi:hypothetical protein
MGVPALKVGYTSATTGRGDHEVHKGHVVSMRRKKSLKIRQMEAELFHVHRQTDGQTGMTKIIVVFRNFVNAPTNVSIF